MDEVNRSQKVSLIMCRKNHQRSALKTNLLLSDSGLQRSLLNFKDSQSKNLGKLFWSLRVGFSG